MANLDCLKEDTIRILRLHREQSHAVPSLVYCALDVSRCPLESRSLDHRLHDALNVRDAAKSGRPNNSAANDSVEQWHAFLHRRITLVTLTRENVPVVTR